MLEVGWEVSLMATSWFDFCLKSYRSREKRAVLMVFAEVKSESRKFCFIKGTSEMCWSVSRILPHTEEQEVTPGKG